ASRPFRRCIAFDGLQHRAQGSAKFELLSLTFGVVRATAPTGPAPFEIAPPPPPSPSGRQTYALDHISAFPSSRRVNSWLSFKRLFWAVPGKAGGTAVMTTIDHTLCAGRNRMTVDTSRSCLGLATSVGSAIRQIVDARVLLTASAPQPCPAAACLVVRWRLP